MTPGPFACQTIRLGDRLAQTLEKEAKQSGFAKGQIARRALEALLQQEGKLRVMSQLIAALNRDDRHHRWACSTLDRLGPPFHSCPEALAEASAMTGQAAAIVEMVRAGEIVLTFDLSAQAASVLALLKKHADREMDLADACIVRMSELVSAKPKWSPVSATAAR